MGSPFVLHLGFDGWQAVEDRLSASLPFGRHGVRLSKGELVGRGVLDFTRYFLNEGKWEGADHHIRLASEQQVEDRKSSAAGLEQFAI
jgi:hypothetical protein